MFQNIKRIYRLKVRLFAAFLLPGYFFLLTGCNTRIEGCLDVAAANFAFDADRACEDCCTYPSLSISLSQKWNDRNFSTNDTLSDVNGIPYRITDLKYFLSSWSWQDAADLSFTVDSAEIACDQTILRYTPDIIMADARQFQYMLGTIRHSPLIDSIQLILGVIPAFDCIDAASASTPIVLSDRSALWNQELSSRAAVRIVLQPDPAVEVFDTLFIHTIQNVNLEYVLDIQAGLQTTLKLTVDYARWFLNADIQNPESFENSILSGIKGSIFKTPE